MATKITFAQEDERVLNIGLKAGLNYSWLNIEDAEDETGKILRLLKENNGYLPFHDKSDPEEIYSFFGMSKKTFKMSTGSLYKQRKIEFTKTGIKLLEE